MAKCSCSTQISTADSPTALSDFCSSLKAFTCINPQAHHLPCWSQEILKVKWLDYVCHPYMLKTIHERTSLLLRVKNLSELTPNMKRGIAECPVVLKQISKEMGKTFTWPNQRTTICCCTCCYVASCHLFLFSSQHNLNGGCQASPQRVFAPYHHEQFTTPLFPDPRKTANTLYYIFIAQHIIAPNVWTVTTLLLIEAYPHIFLSIDIMMKGWKLTGKAENLII